MQDETGNIQVLKIGDADMKGLTVFKLVKGVRYLCNALCDLWEGIIVGLSMRYAIEFDVTDRM